MKKSPSSALLYTCAFVAMLCWGLSFVWTKMVFEYYQPFTVVLLRMAVSSALLFLFSWLGNAHEKIQKRDVGSFLLLAFFEPFCYFLGESFGLKEVSSTVAAVIIATIPVFTCLLAPVLFHEKWSKSGVAGVLCSFLGIIFVVFDAKMSFRYSPRGIFLLFFAVFAAIGYNVMTRRLARTYRALTIVKFQNFIGGFFVLPFFFCFEVKSFLAVRPSASLIGNLLALTLFASTLAFLLYNYTIKHIGVVRANVFTNLIPLFTAAASFVLLDEKFDAAKVVGMMLVLVGVFISQFGSRPSRSLESSPRVPEGGF